MARRATFEYLPVGACFAFDPETPRATRRKIDKRHTIVIPGGKRPLTVSDVDVPVRAMACPTSFGRPVRVRCEVFATVTPHAKRMEYAGSFMTCKAAEDYAKSLRDGGHKARVQKKGR